MSTRKTTAAPSPEDDNPFAPRRNPDLTGHEAAEHLLLEAWRGGRLPHAWLIGGPPGIGKATLAFRFARFVLAQGAPEAEPAGLFGAPPPPDSLHVEPSHPVARRVGAGGHADLLTVERQHNEKSGKLRHDIVVDDVRRISPFLRMTSAEGGWRVAVVDGAERMNLNAVNALLKILEEPPPGALLLLVTENPGAMLPTVRSRCRKLLLKPLPEAKVVHLLGRYRPELGEADRVTLARLGEGSVGRALALAKAGGVELYRDMVGVLETLPRLDLVAVHGFAERLARKGGDTIYDTVSDLLVWWLARLARGLARGELPAEVVPGEAAFMRRLAANPSGLDRWVEVWEKVSRLFAQADSANLDRKQVMLNALLTVEAAAA